MSRLVLVVLFFPTVRHKTFLYSNIVVFCHIGLSHWMAVRYVAPASSRRQGSLARTLSPAICRRHFRPHMPRDAPIQQSSNLDSTAVQTSASPSLVLTCRSQPRFSTSFSNKRALTGCDRLGQYARGTMGYPSGQGIGFRCSCCLPN